MRVDAPRFTGKDPVRCEMGAFHLKTGHGLTFTKDMGLGLSSHLYRCCKAQAQTRSLLIPFLNTPFHFLSPSVNPSLGALSFTVCFHFCRSSRRSLLRFLAAAMEFWGVEVKAGHTLKVAMEPGKIIHISQASLGEQKKGKGSDLIPLFVEINEKKFVMSSLSSENIPQVTFDLVFEKDFVLSHGAKNGSIYFCGYSTANPFLDKPDFDDDDSSEEDIPEDLTENGKIEAKPEEVKPSAASKGKSVKPESSTKAKIVDSKKEDSDDSEDDSEDDSSDDEEMQDASDDDDLSGSEDDEDEDSSDDEDEETPQKVESSKKRKESAEKTPVPTKKAKIVTPQKTGGKKSGHTATPHPSKKTSGKTPAATSNTKDKSPKSDGKVTCGSCSKVFNSEGALQSHSKAKHGAK